MREFITQEKIAMEVKIILSPKIINYNNPNQNKNSFFSKNIIKKRYKNLFNSNNFKNSYL